MIQPPSVFLNRKEIFLFFELDWFPSLKVARSETKPFIVALAPFVAMLRSCFCSVLVIEVVLSK